MNRKILSFVIALVFLLSSTSTALDFCLCAKSETVIARRSPQAIDEAIYEHYQWSQIASASLGTSPRNDGKKGSSHNCCHPCENDAVKKSCDGHLSFVNQAWRPVAPALKFHSFIPGSDIKFPHDTEHIFASAKAQPFSFLFNQQPYQFQIPLRL